MLNETLSPILYHITTLEKFFDIVSADRFKLSLSFKEKDIIGRGDKVTPLTGREKYFYHASFARSITSSFFRKFNNHAVIMELDGRALSAKYAGSPVEYWSQKLKSKGEGEYEDRLFSDRPEIPGFSKYIRKVYIIFREDLLKRGVKRNIPEIFSRVVELLQKKNIPYSIHLVPDEKSFTSFQAYTVDEKEMLNILKEYAKGSSGPFPIDMETHDYYMENILHPFRNILEKAVNGRLENIKGKEISIAKKIVYPHLRTDLESDFRRIVSMINANPSLPARDVFVDIVRYMKKMKTYKFEELLEKLEKPLYEILMEKGVI